MVAARHAHPAVAANSRPCRGPVCVGAALGISGRSGLTLLAKSPMRVLALVTDAFGGHGGIAQYNRDFLSALARCDRVGDVIVLPRLSATSVDALPDGVRQLRAVENRLAYSAAALWTAINYQPIDLVFCGHLFMAPLAAVIARVLKVPLWVQVHGIEVWRKLSALQRCSVESATIVTSVSRYTRRRLLERVGIEQARVKVLPNTVSPQYQPGPKPAYLLDRHAAGGKKALMTVSRLDSSEQYKGHDRVIRALPGVLSQHPDTIYLVVGDGDDRPRLESLAAECGVAKNVQFTGLVPPEELPDYFRLADVFVMPSAGEGFGIVFLQAMAAGIHVIAGSQDGSRDALCDGALGTLVDPENCEELASAILTALDNPARTGDRTTRFKPDLFREHLNALNQCFSVQNGGALAALWSPQKAAALVLNAFNSFRKDQQCLRR
jgi:phosphatidyl-myo-inositol dimannoside synthase